jgi:dehydrogenase/reductase SDR family protein 7B
MAPKRMYICFVSKALFKSKVIWITGANSGIGKELAFQLDSKGARLILSARNEKGLKEVLESMQNKEQHLILPLDLAVSHHFQELAEKVFHHFGHIDILINNGGVSQRSSVSETPIEIDRRIMEVNYFGNIALTKAVLPYMIKQQGGHIVVISSIAGKFGFFLRSAYSAAKHALHGFYESLMLEQAPNNVKVTIVCPGKINTPISKNALNADGTPHGKMDQNQAKGMAVDAAVKEIIYAIQKEKKEVLIGKGELWAVTIKRFLPSIFWKLISRQSAT